MLRDRDKNKLAVEAIELFKNKAELCENQRRKIAKLPGDGDSDDSLFKGTSTTGVHLDLPGPSTSAGSGGAIAKRSPTSTPTGSKGKVTPVLRNRQNKDLRTNDSLMKIKSIAECSLLKTNFCHFRQVLQY